YAEAESNEFTEGTIIYDNLFTEGEENNEPNDLSNITADVHYTFNFPSEISTSGFMIICTEFVGGNYVVNTDEGGRYGVDIQNGHLAWNNLLNNYHVNNNPFLEGVIDWDPVTFASKQRNKQQNVIEIGEYIDIDNTKLVRTNLGDGEIFIKEHFLEQNIIKLTLVYE
ncbi:unnamed protein product, partial [marine sediment metagenome]